MKKSVTASAYATTVGYTDIERVDTGTGYKYGSYYSAMYNTSNGSSIVLYE